MADILNLTKKKPQKFRVIFPNGVEHELRSPLSLTIGETEAFQRHAEELAKGFNEESLHALMKIIVPDASEDEVRALSFEDLQAIIDFFTDKAKSQASTTDSSRSPGSSDSTAAA